MTEFNRPGSDGALPSGFAQWQCGLTYTVRPQMLRPLLRGREYRINFSVRRKCTRNEEFRAYGDLYGRAVAIARARIAELTCADDGEPIHTWIRAHGWFAGEAFKIPSATLTLGLVFPNERSTQPQGEQPPSSAELMAPGGFTPEMLVAKGGAPKQIDEIYTDFDFRDPTSSRADVMISYGENIQTCNGIDFHGVLQRAEGRARFYFRLFPSGQACEKSAFQIVRREWYCIEDAQFAVAVVYLRI